MIRVDCDTCKQRGRCGAESDLRRVALFDSIVRDLCVPSCPEYQPRWWRGIEGVLDLPASPHPSLLNGQNMELSS